MQIHKHIATNPNGDNCTIIVEMMEGGEQFRVYVDGGLLSDGEDDFVTNDLRDAEARLLVEAQIARQGD